MHLKIHKKNFEEYTSGDSDNGVLIGKQFYSMSSGEQLYHIKELWRVCYSKSFNAQRILRAFKKVN